MYILVIPVGFILWYFAYAAKPIINDEINYLIEKENLLKRIKLKTILKESF